MYCVYTLSIEKAIFYVGMTSRPLGRYKDHFYDPCSACYDITRYLLSIGKVCKMDIKEWFETKGEAEIKEGELMRQLNKYYKLINNSNLYNSIIYHAIPKTPRILNAALLRPFLKELKHIETYANNKK